MHTHRHDSRDNSDEQQHLTATAINGAEKRERDPRLLRETDAVIRSVTYAVTLRDTHSNVKWKELEMNGRETVEVRRG